MLFRSSKNAESSIFIFRVRPAIRVLSTGSRGVVMLLGIRLAVYTVKFVPGNGELLLKPGGGRSAQGGSVQCSH